MWVQISLLEECCKTNTCSSQCLDGQRWGASTLPPPARVCRGEREGSSLSATLLRWTKKKCLLTAILFPSPLFLMNQHLLSKKKKMLCCNPSNPFYYQLQNYGYCYKWFVLEIIRRVRPNWTCLVLGKAFCIILSLPEYIQFLWVPLFWVLALQFRPMCEVWQIGRYDTNACIDYECPG